MQWIGMFTSYYRGIKTDTPMVTAGEAQQAIEAVKKMLTEQEVNSWAEQDDTYFGRKILVRTAIRSKDENTIEEWGWAWAIKLPTADDPWVPAQTAEDVTSSLR